MSLSTKKLCAKHGAEYDRWADWGPWRPLPRGLTLDTVKSQLRGIEATCAAGNVCGTAADAFTARGDA